MTLLKCLSVIECRNINKNIFVWKSSTEGCKENEEYTTCGPCEKTCEELNPICTFDCKVGCLCKNGFVRDVDDNCILAKDCRKLNN